MIYFWFYPHVCKYVFYIFFYYNFILYFYHLVKSKRNRKTNIILYLLCHLHITGTQTKTINNKISPRYSFTLRKKSYTLLEFNSNWKCDLWNIWNTYTLSSLDIYVFIWAKVITYVIRICSENMINDKKVWLKLFSFQL